jgi:hypothetical protein
MYISAQNTILNKDVPNFCFEDLGDGQVLTWDKDKRAFVNTNVIDLNLEVPLGVDDIRIFEAFGNGTQSLYPIPWPAISPESLIITLGGVKQENAAYDITTFETFTNVQFAEPIPTGLKIEIVGLIVEDASSIKFFETQGDGSSFQYTLPWIAPGKESLIVTIEGIKQEQAAYDITVIGNDTLFTFNGIPQVTDTIEIVGITGNFGTTNYGVEAVFGANLSPLGEGVFASESVAGKETTLNFKNLLPGWGIELSSDATGITIAKTADSVSYTANPVYPLVATDEVKVFEASSPVSCVVPLNSTVAFPIGYEIEIIQRGTGVVVITGDTGVIVESLNGANITTGPGSVARLRKIYDDVWSLSGDII